MSKLLVKCPYCVGKGELVKEYKLFLISEDGVTGFRNRIRANSLKADECRYIPHEPKEERQRALYGRRNLTDGQLIGWFTAEERQALTCFDM